MTNTHTSLKEQEKNYSKKRQVVSRIGKKKVWLLCLSTFFPCREPVIPPPIELRTRYSAATHNRKARDNTHTHTPHAC